MGTAGGEEDKTHAHTFIPQMESHLYAEYIDISMMLCGLTPG